ncbi:alpha/beta fold hydrolase [Tersicoccus sp. MR15.9]|uniref:alpha/beta fold hydrolase n=1 Tax=Tersicoccus mangrovi TaxID=3121635 RepID=UPI002FE5B6B3
MTRVVLVHGSGRAGAAAWPEQRLLAGRYDCLFLRRRGYEASGEPARGDAEADAASILEHLEPARGGHVVAHSGGAVSALLAAVREPGLVRSLTLIEPAAFSLTRDLPATARHVAAFAPLYVARERLSADAFAHRFTELLTGTGDGAPTGVDAVRLQRQQPPWEAPLTIVPGVPTLVVTGGWEPVYEEVATFLATTGARHVIVPGGHRPHDTAAGHAHIAGFLAELERDAA